MLWLFVFFFLELEGGMFVLDVLMEWTLWPIDFLAFLSRTFIIFIYHIIGSSKPFGLLIMWTFFKFIFIAHLDMIHLFLPLGVTYI